MRWLREFWKMNIYAYIRMRHKLKSAPVRVLLEDYVSGETLADVRINVEDRLAPFSDYEIVGSRWVDEKKDSK